MDPNLREKFRFEHPTLSEDWLKGFRLGGIEDF